MNNFLKKREDIDICTQYIRDTGLIEHGISCKNFDIASILPRLSDGDILDMGSSGGSCIMENAIQRKLTGRRVGIDLEYTQDSVLSNGIELIKGDLMATPFSDTSFNYITCLSVIEHGVDFQKLAKECARLLKGNGNGTLYLTFDYWPEKINTDGLMLYGLPWNILSRGDVELLLIVFAENGLHVTSEIDWTVMDQVINPQYCSPFPGISYTFGIFEFEKK